MPQPVLKARTALQETVLYPSFYVLPACVYPPCTGTNGYSRGKFGRETELNPVIGTLPLTLAGLGASLGS